MKKYSITAVTFACAFATIAACSSSSDTSTGNGTDASTNPGSDSSTKPGVDGSVSPPNDGGATDSGTTNPTDGSTLPPPSGDADIEDAGTLNDAAVYAVSVDAIDTGDLAVGTQINVDSAYVAAIDAQNRHFWIADTLAASPNAGIYVYRGGNVLGFPQGFVVGAKVSVKVGSVAQTKVLYQISPDTGSAGSEQLAVISAPTTMPSVVATTIATFIDATAGRPYYGSLVSLAGPVKVASVTAGVATMVDNSAHTFEMGNTIFAANPVVGTCYASLAGIASLDTVPTAAVPTILPRASADVVVGTGCN